MTIWPKRPAVITPRKAEDIEADEQRLRHAANIGFDFIYLIARGHFQTRDILQKVATDKMEQAAAVLAGLKHAPEYDGTP